MVIRAGSTSSTVKKQAIAQLLELYRPAMRAFLSARTKNHPSLDADDLISDFLLSQVLEKDLIAKAERERGRFRNFLLTALKNFYVSVIRRMNAQKRSPQRPTVDVAVAAPPDRRRDPDLWFEVEWARSVVRQAITQMRQACRDTGQHAAWGVFEARLYLPLFEAQPQVPYAQLVRQLDLRSPVHASNLLMTAKRIFTRHLRAVIGEYEVHGEGAIDEEIDDLMRILSQAPSPVGGRPQTRHDQETSVPV